MLAPALRDACASRRERRQRRRSRSPTIRLSRAPWEGVILFVAEAHQFVCLFQCLFSGPKRRAARQHIRLLYESVQSASNKRRQPEVGMGTRARESEREAAKIVNFLENVTRQRVLLLSCVSHLCCASVGVEEEAASMNSRA